MKTISFTGKCPQCELYDEDHDMRENDKNWECPSCNLQILVEQNHASIFRHRGYGRFKFHFKQFLGNLPYQEVGEDSHPTGRQILIKKHLIEYLLLKVDQKAKYSLDKLIDTYEAYRFNGGNANDYFIQSHKFHIDFDNAGIVEILALRDQEQKLSNQYATARLYYFLVNNIFPKYHNSDNSYLPEAGMSQLEMYLCKKHFPDHKRVLINSNPVFIRQQLKELIVDLIEIIYNNNDVLLSYDPSENLKIRQQKFDISLN